MPDGQRGSLFLAQLLALDADPAGLARLLCAKRRGDHRHAAAPADRWAVVVVHSAGNRIRVTGAEPTMRRRLTRSDR